MEKKALKTIKIIIIGDSEVGKTALMNRYIEDKFYAKYVPV